MGDTLKQRIKQTQFESPQQEAVLNLLIAAHDVKQTYLTVCTAFGITLSQYNVLRILKGIHPDGYPRYEITARMLEPAPDVTRLIDRLVKLALVERVPCTHDRRLSITKVTRKGLLLLEKMHPKVSELDNEFFKRKLTRQECAALSTICEKLYDVWP
jgi:DNA-binding MarR family transcriptional regulator